MTRARDLADIVSGNFAIPSGSLSNVQTPTLSSLGIDTRVFPTGWSAALSGSDMVLSHSGTAKVKIASDGSVLATDDVTAFGSI
jgi:hypothetical protein